MHKIYDMMHKIEECMSAQIDGGMEKINTDEFGKVADIYKDLAKARYYCVVTDAMENNKEDYGKTWDENGMIHKI